MHPNRKALALAFGLVLPLGGVIASAQQPQKPDGQTLVIDDASIDWYQKSDVSALRPGVIDKIELRIGREVGKAGDIIGVLHKESADLAVKEAEIQAKGEGAILKAEAQKKLAEAVIQTNRALNRQGKNFVSREEMQKAEAEYMVADAALIEAQDTQALAVAKLKSAEQTALEHFIRAPFPGYIIEEYKHEGESVQANDPVVRLGNLNKVRVWAYIPVEYYSRVGVGTQVEIQRRLPQSGGRLGRSSIEDKKFRGAVSFVDPTIQTVGETGVRIYAEIDNLKHELRPGGKATMTLLLGPERSDALGSGAAEAAPSIGVNPGGLPPLPPR